MPVVFPLTTYPWPAMFPPLLYSQITTVGLKGEGEGSPANTHWLTPRFHAQLQFLSKSDVWHGYYGPVPIWGADDGLISLFPCDSSL